MALLMKIFGLTSILFILPKIPASIGYTSVSCPIITNVRSNCGSRIENICLSDSECSEEDKCCPRAADGGCSLMCVKPRALEGCPVPVDFALIVDTSGSISRRNFKRLLEFIESMLDGFDISEDGTHVAVVEYSTKPSVQMRFDDFSGAMLNAANLKRKVRRIPHSRGFTYIDKALHLANTDVFSAIGGMRPNVTKIALVMTDGKQTLDDERALTTDILLEAVQPLKDKGVRVISLGIGSGTLLLDLLTLASTDNDVYLAADFLELKGLVKDLTASKCPVDGDWSEWSEWSECPVTCGGGQQKRFRECDNPYPAFGGKPCPGNSEESRLCNTLPCAVDGNWTAWRDWEVCSVSCGGGTQNRVRTCTNPLPAHGGKDCVGEGVITRRCNEDPCPVDGKWTDWGDWDLCSVTCAGGTQSRSRTCTNPPPRNGGRDCSGESKDVRSCNELPCPIDGKWGEWRAWEPCSVSCGGGTQMSRRTCTDPAPAHGGADCEGVSVRSRSCNEKGCPVDGKWTDWGDWDLCSVTCAGGTQSRSRTCTNPPPRNGGRDCSGESEDVRSCNELPCPIDGRWAKWRAWEPCSVTCGGGTQMSRRSCTDPAPAFGGAACEGDRVRSRSCNERGCPVDANWSEWSKFSPCTLSCGGGTHTRTRTCTNPPPKFDGQDCVGESEDVQQCNTLPCPVDGKWTVWGKWSICPVTCGGGVQDRSRTCTDPKPAFGGAPCVGASKETRSCSERPCPGDGSWSAWKAWSPCTVTCAGGRQSRSRSCTNPPPTHGGKDCLGKSDETRSCNQIPCPVDGRWTRWSDWGACPVKCGGGTQARSRSCANPPPAFGGAKCVGERRQVQACNEHPCEIDGNWARWRSWSICTKTCGGGTQDRTRTCTNPPPAHGGRDCPGKNKEARSCNNLPCPVDGKWAAWKAWGRCSRSCGGGTQVRSRTCSNPPPAYRGSSCPGRSSETQSCNEDIPCPVNGGWSYWSGWGRCSVTCGSGILYRYRTCTNPPPTHGGSQCVGHDRESYYCDRKACPVDGAWAQWGRWSRCSATCSGGIRRRERDCTNPRPSNGGKDCPGDRMEEVKCNTKQCAVNGKWGRWTRWSACSKTCGYGKRMRFRECNNPPPANGGRDCYGSKVAMVYCNTHLPCQVTCNVPLDFAILVDTSGSISRRNFKLLLRFIRSIVDGFEVSEDHTHIAIIEYSTKATVQLKFNDLPGSSLNKQNVRSRVRAIPHQRGFTYIDKALLLANEQVFTLEAGMRPDVRQVALVMTDGEQTLDESSEKTVNEILAEAAQTLKDKNVHIISLGIGQRVNKSSLETIATGDNVYYAKTFSALRQLVRKLRKGSCIVTAAGRQYKYIYQD
ncbi:SCO-spondin-like isoform X7 [Oculina patagonica]